MTTSALIPAGPLRRLGAMLYDALLVIAILMVVTALYFLLSGGQIPRTNGISQFIYRMALLLSIVGFFGFFWTRKGCTLGMQVWRIKIVTRDAALPTWRDTLLRLAAALLPWLPALIVIALAVQEGAPRVLLTIGYGLFALVPLNYLAGYWTPNKRALHELGLRTLIVRSGPGSGA